MQRIPAATSVRYDKVHSVCSRLGPFCGAVLSRVGAAPGRTRMEQRRRPKKVLEFLGRLVVLFFYRTTDEMYVYVKMAQCHASQS